MEEVHVNSSPEGEDEALKPVLIPLEDQSREKATGAGSLCPKCHHGVLDYDGMLNLSCPVCGYKEGGCFT
jgi:uncharacterized protein (DUF983 family)